MICNIISNSWVIVVIGIILDIIGFRMTKPHFKTIRAASTPGLSIQTGSRKQVLKDKKRLEESGGGIIYEDRLQGFTIFFIGIFLSVVSLMCIINNSMFFYKIKILIQEIIN